MIRSYLKLLLCCFFTVASLNAQAQITAGNVNRLKSRLDQAVDNISSGPSFRLEGEKDSIVLTTNLQTELVLAVRKKKHMQTESHYYGRLSGIAASSFRMSFQGDRLKGLLLDKQHHKAYEVSSDISGQVIVTAISPEKVICTEYAEAVPDEPQAAVPATGSQVYTLQSNPASKSVAYLDFNGQVVEGTSWVGGDRIDALPGNFTETDIQNIFRLVSEDFAPFNINITTDENVYNAATLKSRVRCIFTITKTASPSAGGVAYIGSFTWGDDTPCWVFNGGAKNAGEAASHEIGHTLGLQHDGRTIPKEDYFNGQGSWAPIMGVGYSRTVVQWSSGEYKNANNKQDDLNTIATRNGFTYKADATGNTPATAAPLTVAANGTVASDANTGLIETRTDRDVFSFTSLGGTVALSANPAANYPNLNIQLELLDAQGQVLQYANPTTLNASLSYNVTPGTYYIVIDGSGDKSALNDGYSDYASLGVYSISGTIPVLAPANILPNVKLINPLAGASATSPATFTLSATANDPDGSIAKVEFYNGTTKVGEALTSPYSFNWANVAAGSYTITARATDNKGGVFTSASVGISVVRPSCKVANTLIPINYVIGNDSSYNNNGNTRIMAFDNDSSTYFDSPVVNAGWAGIDMDGIYTITGIRYFPRSAFNSRMTGGKFQGSATADFSSGVTDLATIATTPANNAWSCITVSNTGKFKYVRYLAPTGSNCNVAEIQFYGINARDTPPTVKITSPVPKTRSTIPQNITVTVAASDADGTITKVELFDNGVKLGESAAPYQFTIPTSAKKDWKLVAKATDNLGEYTLSDTVMVYSRFPVCSLPGERASYTAILGTTGSRNTTGLTREKAADQDSSTYFDAPNASNSWVGFDLGAEKQIRGVTFYPRIGNSRRMVNGRFQIANNAAFTQGLVSIDTLLSVTEDAWNCVTFSAVYTKRYFRYLSPAGSYGNIAELQVVVVKDIATGLENETEAEGITLYPNPAKDLVQIRSSLEIEKITLTSLNGTVLGEYNTTTLQLPPALSGLFFVKVAYANGSSVISKLVITE